jgi:hypothetical protein
MVYFNNYQFNKLDNICYIINQGVFDENGDVAEVPVPGIVLHYKYHEEVLVITAFKAYSGETETTDSTYIIRSKDFGITQFIVTPLNYNEEEGLAKIEKNPSFKSLYNAMGYIFETKTGHYLPASFNTGPELEVNYTHPDVLSIKIFKEINDILIAEAKKVFPNL